MAKKKAKTLVEELDLSFKLSPDDAKDLNVVMSDCWNKEENERANNNKNLKKYIENPQESVFEVLRKNNIRRLVVEFSGGNDSGGTDGCFVVFSGDEQEDEHTIDLSSFDICSIVEKPIYDKYYGFAWNGEVHGRCTWDVENNNITLSGTETNYDSQNNNFDL